MLPTDAPLLAEIFRASIEELTADDYSEAQQEAWAAAADDEEEFARQACRRVDAGRDLRRRRGRLCLARRQHDASTCSMCIRRRPGRAPAPCCATRSKSSPPRAAPRN